jgi:hypothetical protein
MKNIALLLAVFLVSCGNEKLATTENIIQEVSSHNETAKSCSKCPESIYADNEPKTAFEFSNGKKVLLCGYVEEQNRKKIYSEFVISECGTDSIIDFWSAVESYEVEFEADTLKLVKLKVLAIADSRALERSPWLTENFYYKGNILKRELRLNPKVRYSKNQIDETLKEYESTIWKTQNTSLSEEYNDDKMLLANRLMIAAISGSSKADSYFKDFDYKFKPDGAYAEWYEEMKELLKEGKEKKKADNNVQKSMRVVVLLVGNLVPLLSVLVAPVKPLSIPALLLY